jgi:hypothetical protein
MEQKAVSPPFWPSDDHEFIVATIQDHFGIQLPHHSEVTQSEECDKTFKVRTSSLSHILVCGKKEYGLFLVLLLPLEQMSYSEGCIDMNVLQ